MMTKKALIITLLLLALSNDVFTQTMHSIIFIDTTEKGRESDRTVEMNKMTSFCNTIANALNFRHNIRTHSASEFTQAMMEKEISDLRVKDGDIVLLYYAGHGCNWDDDDWPHMALRDRQYWESTAYSKLKGACKNAKLTLCIASCCNLDSEGRRRRESMSKAIIDPQKVRTLFLGFNGKKSIIMSSSVRGEVTYSTKEGSVFSNQLRKTIMNAVCGEDNISLNWTSILENTKNRTIAATQNYKSIQHPQYKIENGSSSSSSGSNFSSSSTRTSHNSSAKVLDTRIEHNVNIGGINSMVIHVDFETHFITEYGGRIIAFFDSPKGVGVKDLNGKYCTTANTVCAGTNFGTHYDHSLFKDIKITIPNDEIHASYGTHTYYVHAYIWCNKTKKYIANGPYISFDITVK